MAELFVSQLVDPFRIGFIFFLLLTALRTRHQTGMVVPLCLGVVFVAILLPITTANAGPDTADRITAMISGIVSNAIILSVLLAGWTVWRRTR